MSDFPKRKKPKYREKAEVPEQYDTDEFYKLRQKWYDKLERKGFEDIEWTQPKGHAESPYFARKAAANLLATYKPETEEHFRRCNIHANHGKFENNTDKHIFKLYVQGKSYREILKIIQTNPRVKCNGKHASYIHYRIHRILDHINKERLWEKDLTTYKPKKPLSGRAPKKKRK